MLESFFLYEEETSEISELCDIFETARSSNTNESYIFLLEKLQSYSKDIPGFVVRNCPTAHGRVLAVAFSKPNKKIKETIIKISRDNNSIVNLAFVDVN